VLSGAPHTYLSLEYLSQLGSCVYDTVMRETHCVLRVPYCILRREFQGM